LATIKENKAFWDGDYDWMEEGHEWSRAWGGADMQWHGTIMPRLHRYVPVNTVLEIAPGFGRWTNYLKDLCNRLILVDLSKKCIDGCRKKFSAYSNIEYHVNDGSSLAMVPDEEVDLVFSFDSLVHAERDVMESYVKQIAQKLSKDGVAFIHHSNIGEYKSYYRFWESTLWPKSIIEWFKEKNWIEPYDHWRAFSMTGRLMEKMIKDAGLFCMTQEYINWGTKPNHLIDCITVFSKRGSKWEGNTRRLYNRNFMKEAGLISELSKLYGVGAGKKRG